MVNQRKQDPGNNPSRTGGGSDRDPADHSRGSGGSSWRKLAFWSLVLLCLLLLGYSALASVAYWGLERESTARIAHLEKEVDTRERQMNRMLRDRTGLEASLEEMERALKELRQRQSVADQRMTEFRELLIALRDLRDAGSLTVRIVDGRAVIALPFDILFASGSSKLSSRGEKAIRELTGVLSQLEKHRFQIEGHTDSDPIRKPGYTNWELASDRALVVLHTMVDAGMDYRRISAASFGPARPVEPNNTPARKARNRRIEIVLVPDLSVLPGAAEMEELLREMPATKSEREGKSD